jgi:hypothetical protein
VRPPLPAKIDGNFGQRHQQQSLSLTADLEIVGVGPGPLWLGEEDIKRGKKKSSNYQPLFSSFAGLFLLRFFTAG